MMNRYIRQLALPEMTQEKQEKLAQSTIFYVGVGGLGSAALPYLVGAGVGHIIIADNDRIEISNLHRQTIYRADQAGQSKAMCAGNYLRALNPDSHIQTINERIDEKNGRDLLLVHNADLIMDGSDNFETKSTLNNLSIERGIPLLSASITGFEGQIGAFEGYHEERPCYRCLFPELPHNMADSEEVGVLGTSTGIIGMVQAHIALCCLLGIDIKHNHTRPFMRINLKSAEILRYALKKDPLCKYCSGKTVSVEKRAKMAPLKHKEYVSPSRPPEPEIKSINVHQLENIDTLLIDLRQPEDVMYAPIISPLITQHPRNIPLPELSEHLDMLPKDRRIAFLCPKNMRSVQAAQYLLSKGFSNVCILDRFSF